MITVILNHLKIFINIENGIVYAVVLILAVKR